MIVQMSDTENSTRVVRRIDYDFNSPLTEAGFYEVVLKDPYFRAGDEVVMSDDGLRRRGRIRCLMAVIEPISDFEHVE